VVGHKERRNIRRRAAQVQRLITSVIDTPRVTFTVETLRDWLDVPTDAAQRILAKLAASGLMRQVQTGVWVRGSVPGLAPSS
jgi:hypothetical protein